LNSPPARLTHSPVPIEYAMPLNSPWSFMEEIEEERMPRKLFDDTGRSAVPMLSRAPSTDMMTSMYPMPSPRSTFDDEALFSFDTQEPLGIEFGNMLLTDVPMRSVSVGGPAAPSSSPTASKPATAVIEPVLTSHPALKYPEAIAQISTEADIFSGAVPAGPAPTEASDEERLPHGVYSKAQRRAVIARYHHKRKTRTYRHVVRYQSRKRFADKRVRVGGRFVKIHNRPDELFSSALSYSLAPTSVPPTPAMPTSVPLPPAPVSVSATPTQGLTAPASSWSSGSPSLKPLAAVDSQLKLFSL